MSETNIVANSVINTVIFDIGGVLVGLGREKFFEGLGYDHEMSLRLLNATAGTKYWKEFDRGVLSEEEIIDLFVRNAPELETDIRRSMQNTHGLVYPLQTSIPWIERVKAGGRKALYLSNFSRKIERENQDAMKFLPHLDGGVFSCDVKMIKPDRDIYECLLQRYSLDPERCVFLDDTEANLVTAAELGIHTIHVQSHEQAAGELDAMLG